MTRQQAEKILKVMLEREVKKVSKLENSMVADHIETRFKIKKLHEWIRKIHTNKNVLIKNLMVNG